MELWNTDIQSGQIVEEIVMCIEASVAQSVSPLAQRNEQRASNVNRRCDLKSSPYIVNHVVVSMDRFLNCKAPKQRKQTFHVRPCIILYAVIISEPVRPLSLNRSTQIK